MTLLAAPAMAALGQQIAVPRIELLPDRPSPYRLRDWRQTAIEFDRLVFDLDRKGPNLPLIWRVPNVPNISEPGFGMPSYVGSESMRGKPAEGIAAMGALLGATAVGIDKRSWVDLTPQYFNSSEGTVLNNVGGKSGATFWYELLPSIDFAQLSTKYPSWSQGREIARRTADTWIEGLDALGSNFDHTSYSFSSRQPVDNKLWTEPDAAAAVGYLELLEGLRSGDAKYLAASRRALGSLQNRETNPTYEVLTAYGALAGSYLNAVHGEHWDVPRFVNWCFDPTSPARTGWGMIVGKWGGYDVGGLMGSTNEGGGYAFAMNSFVNAATLAPVARYDDRFSGSMAKWILNLSNASRLFYRDSLPPGQQSSWDWKGDAKASIAYEGLRRSCEGKAPFATGDAKNGGSAATDFGIYGGGYVGLLGALVHPTNVPMILRIDLRATDYLPVKAYPTDLYWNPYDTAKTVKLPLEAKKCRLYDAVSNRFLPEAPFVKLRPKQAVQIVQVPRTGDVVVGNRITTFRGVAIDYDNGRTPLPPPIKHHRRDDSVTVRVRKALSNAAPDWAAAAPIRMNGGEGSTMRAELRFAWDDRFLRFRITQSAPATETVEVPSRAELQKHWWDFESVVFNLDLGREELAVACIPEVTVAWNSRGAKNLGYSPDLPKLECWTSGTAEGTNRAIEGRIAWADLRTALGLRKPFVQAGLKIGCQPLLVDGTFKRQSYVGGARYSRPTGFDRNSRTLILSTK